MLVFFIKDFLFIFFFLLHTMGCVVLLPSAPLLRYAVQLMMAAVRNFVDVPV